MNARFLTQINTFRFSPHAILHLVFESSILIFVDLCYFFPNIGKKRIEQAFHIRRGEENGHHGKNDGVYDGEDE